MRPRIELFSIANGHSACTNSLVGQRLCGPSKSVAWTFTLSYFLVAPAAFNIIHIFEVFNCEEDLFVPVLRSRAVCPKVYFTPTWFQYHEYALWISSTVLQA
ncbi:unnamed protein product [Owenia fusiformis]|uniref:Uncharacterized protein n=1 Tax=Owenia fusiformis TaxID=6347 RepID=A0A8J1T8F2_OWEFU|nr:unnamed protein product [Owenia fusiformis]